MTYPQFLNHRHAQKPAALSAGKIMWRIWLNRRSRIGKGEVEWTLPKDPRFGEQGKQPAFIAGKINQLRTKDSVAELIISWVTTAFNLDWLTADPLGVTKEGLIGSSGSLSNSSRRSKD